VSTLKKPSVFIGSSSEKLDFAYAVQENLQHDAEVTVWNQDVFKLTSYTLVDLVDHLDRTDFAIFVVAPDDEIKLRGQASAAARDNVIFELGLFIGRLGRDRCFFLVPLKKEDELDLRLPSDLAGLKAASYDSGRSDKNWRAALGPACNQIRKSIQALKAISNHDRLAATVADHQREITSLRRFVDEVILMGKDLYFGTDGPLDYPAVQTIEETVQIEADASCFYQGIYRITSKKQPLGHARYYAGGDAELPDFSGMNLKVESLAASRRVIWLPVRDSPRKKEFAVFFRPEIQPGDTAEFRIRWRWPGLWKPLIEQGRDEWYYDARSTQTASSLKMAFRVHKSLPEMKLSNVGEGGGAAGSAEVDHGDFRVYRWIVENVHPNSHVVIRLEKAAL